ncbi:MAG: DUF3108 domain-containing protein, partial [Puniceicoccales bacterium]
MAKGPEVGEKAVYELRWSYFAVGSVEISLDVSPDYEHLHRATLDATANAFMRRFHDFHTVIISEFPPDITRSHRYARDEIAEENVHETYFDWEEGTVRYSRNGDTRVPIELKPLTQDPLSIVFAFRSGAVPRTPGVHKVWVTDGEVIDLVDFKVGKPEKV